MQETNIQKNKKLLSQLVHKDRNIQEYLYNLRIVLEVMGFEKLRPNQEDPIFHLFTGKDLLFITPTSGGKTSVAIIPALCMGLKTLIFSPLIALIQDQSSKLQKLGIRVGVINSAVSDYEKSTALAKWEAGELDFLYVAPERLSNQDFLDCMKRSNPDFVVVDEIHCVYEDADSFRPDYCKILPFIKEITPKLFLGMTATMSPDIYRSVENLFELQNTTTMVRSYRRENLRYYTFEVDEHTNNTELDLQVMRELNLDDEPAIVYCSTVTGVERMFTVIGKSIKGGATMYHGQMKPSDREANQQAFLSGKVRVVFATNSFGMGVDKPDIGKVIFRTIPGTIEELIQGFGRGGRDGRECSCILYADFSSLKTQQNFIDAKYPEEWDIRSFYTTLKSYANEENEVRNTLDFICKAAKVDPYSSGAISSILQKEGIIERGEKSHIAYIRYLSMPVKPDKKFDEYKNALDRYGIDCTEKGALHIDLMFLSQQLGYGITTIKNNLKLFAANNWIEYTPPFSGKPIKIVGDVNKIDFRALDEKRSEKREKLRDVLNYIKIKSPADRCDFIEGYFEQHSISDNK